MNDKVLVARDTKQNISGKEKKIESQYTNKKISKQYEIITRRISRKSLCEQTNYF